MRHEEEWHRLTLEKVYQFPQKAPSQKKRRLGLFVSLYYVVCSLEPVCWILCSLSLSLSASAPKQYAFVGWFGRGWVRNGGRGGGAAACRSSRDFEGHTVALLCPSCTHFQSSFHHCVHCAPLMCVSVCVFVCGLGCPSNNST